MDTHGYIKHIPTQDKFWTFSNPHYQRYIALTQGHVPTMHEDFTYVEVGCGNAFSLCVNAAANPKAKFIGVDMSEQAIEAGNELVERLHLKNVTLHHRVIDDNRDVMQRLFVAEDSEIPEADFVFTHNLLSQVSPEVRTSIFEFIGGILRPGGIAFVSYDSMPGSAHRQTIHHVAQSYRDAMDDDKDRIEATFGFMNYLYQTKAHFTLQNNTFVDDLIAGVNDITSETHHFGNEHYTPFWYADVSREMNVQGLFYCGSTTAENNDPNLIVPEVALKELDFPDIETLEFIKDMYGNMESRSDLFIRPMKTDTVVGEILSRMRFTLTAPRKLVVHANNARVGYVELPENMTDPVFDKLARGDALSNLNAEIFHTLVAISKAIVPEIRNDNKLNANVHREFIDYQLENNKTGFVTLVSPFIGSGAIIPIESMLLHVSGSHGAAKKWLESHRHSSIDKDKLQVSVSTRDDYSALIKRLAPDL